MAALRKSDPLAELAAEFWGRVLQADLMKHLRQRHRPAIAGDAGISVKTLERYFYEMKLPPRISIAYAIGRAVGIPEEEVETFYRRADLLRSNAPGNTATARELSPLGAADAEAA